MTFIDSHAHVSFEQFDADRDDVIARAQAANIGWIEVGTDLAQSRKAIEFAAQHDHVWPTVGVHPSDIHDLTDAAWQEIEQLVADPSVVAIGEIGLDYFRSSPLPSGERVRVRGYLETKKAQLSVLTRFITLANTSNLPVIFHVRDPVKSPDGDSGASGQRNAHDDLIEYLQNISQNERPEGVVHTFSGTLEQSRQYLDLGLHLSFSGVVTFKNAGDIALAATQAPLGRILIETDSPFLAPNPHRGARNEPAYVQLVAQKIADLRGASVEEIATATEANTRKLFNLA